MSWRGPGPATTAGPNNDRRDQTICNQYSADRARRTPADLRRHRHRLRGASRASSDGFKLSTDPLFVVKVVDVVGLYHNPSDKAVVLCDVEKSGTQAPDRSQPVLPMMPGMPERRSHDYARHGTTSLFAAFNIADDLIAAMRSSTEGDGAPA